MSYSHTVKLQVRLALQLQRDLFEPHLLAKLASSGTCEANVAVAFRILVPAVEGGVVALCAPVMRQLQRRRL